MPCISYARLIKSSILCMNLTDLAFIEHTEQPFPYLWSLGVYSNTR
jgi:hypothetical protein